MRFTAGLIAALSAASATPLTGIRGYSRTESYEGQKVLQCFQETIDDAEWTKLIDVHGLDEWGNSGPGSVDVRVSGVPAEKAVNSFFSNNCSVVVEDVEALVNGWERDMLESQIAKDSEPAPQQIVAPNTYQTYAQTVAWYQQLVAAYPGFATFTPSIGTSVNGQALPAVVLGATTAPNDRNFYVQCLIHAREWISGATCMYVAAQLLADSRIPNSPAANILRNSRIYLVPFVNPDGYAWTWSNTRLWRKNRRTTAPNSAAAAGVDLNRNYDDFWGQGGSSTVPSSDTYMGPSPASEPETRATVAYFRQIQSRGPIVGALDMHAYSQLILRPFGRSTALSPDEARLNALGATMQRAIQANGGRNYQNIRSIQLYITTGSAGDWLYGAQATAGNGGFRIGAYTYELRPTGATPGFQLPANEIYPNGNEVYHALLEFFQSLITTPIR